MYGYVLKFCNTNTSWSFIFKEVFYACLKLGTGSKMDLATISNPIAYRFLSLWKAKCTFSMPIFCCARYWQLYLLERAVFWKASTGRKGERCSGVLLRNSYLRTPVYSWPMFNDSLEQDNIVSEYLSIFFFPFSSFFFFSFLFLGMWGLGGCIAGEFGQVYLPLAFTGSCFPAQMVCPPHLCFFKQLHIIFLIGFYLESEKKLIACLLDVSVNN